MRRGVLLCPALSSVLVGAAIGTISAMIPMLVTAQNLVLASRAPRFLMVAKPAPVEVDIQQNALLRNVVSLAIPHPTVGRLLAEIERQTGVRFGYSEDLLVADRPIALHADTITVGAALVAILMDTGLDVLLSRGRQVVLVERRKAHAPVARGVLVGRVTDGKGGTAIARAEVLLDGTRWHTMTDTGGRYRLGEIEPGRYTLLVRRFGYAKHKQPVTVGAGEDTVNIALEPVATRLDELVTTATGRQRRRDIGNAITTINADSVLRSAPATNLTDLLENRVPGLAAHRTSGAPGDPMKLRLRGLGSATLSNDPVVIVDGVRIYADQSSARAGNLTNLDPGIQDANGNVIPRANPVGVPAPSPLDQIDPNTIETIEVFKGPSAATLYGPDAANGVIVVTTKRGKPGPTRWDASFTQGRTSSPGQYPIGYYRWGGDIITGQQELCTIVDNLCAQDSLVHFQALNDPNLTVFGHGHSTALSLGTSGGNQALTYAVTGSYSTETGLLRLPIFEVDRFRTTFNQEPPDWMRRPHHLDKWDVTSNITAHLGGTADVTLFASLGREEQQRSMLEQQVAPLAGTYVDRVNQLYYAPTLIERTAQNFGGNHTWYQLALQPVTTILNDYYTRQTDSRIYSVTKLTGSWRPRGWFSATSTAGIDVLARDDQLLRPAGLVALADSGYVSHGTDRTLQSTFNLNGTITKPIGWGFNFVANFGTDLLTARTTTLVTSAARLVPGTTSIAGARDIAATEAAGNTSVFGWYIEPRVSGQRLSFSAGFRVGGGTNYGTKFSGGLALPKLNASWVVSDEPFFPFKSIFNSLRLRGAYGQAQVQPSPADRLRLYQGSPTTGGSLYLTTIGNQGLKPERSTELESGFDADMFGSRVSIELALYQKLQLDALMSMQLPGSVNGGGTVLQNIGNIRNRGLELTLGVTPVRTSVLAWSAQLIYSHNNNILTKLGPGVLASKDQGLVEGYPVHSRWAQPILNYYDVNGDGVLQRSEIQLGDSLVYVGRLEPADLASFFTNLTLFGGAIGVTAGFNYDGGATQINQTAKQNWVLTQALIDPSTPLAQQAAVVASVVPSEGESLPTTDYGLMQEISNLRFNSLSVTYRVPNVLAHRLGAQRLSVAVQGQNLALHSSYNGFDPNVSAWSPGENIVDTGQMPQPRLWQLRVDLQY